MTDKEKKRYVRETSESLAWVMDLVDRERHTARPDDSETQAKVRAASFSAHLDDFVFLARREEICPTCQDFLIQLQTLHAEAGGLWPNDPADQKNRDTRLALWEQFRTHRQSRHRGAD